MYTLGCHVLADAVHLAFQPLARVVVTILEYDGPKAISYIISEIAFIH